jgi:hypothetical protein
MRLFDGWLSLDVPGWNFLAKPYAFVKNFQFDPGATWGAC